MQQSTVSLILKKTMLCLFASSICISATNTEKGLFWYSRGEYDSASQYITMAYKENPAAPVLRYLYASILKNGREAVKIFRMAAEDRNMPDSLRAESSFSAAQYYFAIENYDSSKYFADMAITIKDNDRFRHLKALSALNTGDYATAESIWNTLAFLCEQNYICNPLYYLGNLFYKQKKYKEAAEYYNNTGEPTDKQMITGFLAGSCLAEFYSGNTGNATTIFLQIKNKYPLILETHYLDAVLKKVTGTNQQSANKSVTSAEINNTQKSVVSQNKPVYYTLQTGAFTSLKNAQEILKKMKKKFENITIGKENRDNNVLYKIKIGRFSSKEKAAEYAEKRLQPENIAYIIIEQ